ncbi:glycosyltransferase [Mucilaginibacter sp. McL0603]|uniref:glycosyltransferase n=1 Tax=Mucilaginibacter sp. McL0603 TaxID=3415670 RepID=UPI003CF7FEFB
MPLPKVLIINEAFNNHTGGGITMSNLFSGWETDKIAAVCSPFILGGVDTSICKTYYQLGNKERRYKFPFNIIGRERYSGLVKFEDTKPAPEVEVAKTNLRHKIVMGYLMPFLEYIGLIKKITKTQLSPELCQWLDEFKPDLIYSQAHDVPDITLILLIQAYLKKPLVFHMMDDWLSMITGSPLLRSNELKRNEKAFRMLLDRSDFLMSISDEMSAAYKIRYGKDFTPFHNPIDISFWKRFQRDNYEIGNSPTMLYAGRLGIGIDESLQLIASSIQIVNERLDLNMQFVLQTKEKPAWSTNYTCVEHRGFVGYDDLPKMFSGADFLVLPYDFSPQSIQFIGYSMPTKATEYMISGTPVIIFAPDKTALVNYAKKYQWAKVITENDVTVLSDAITALIQNKEERSQLAQNAIKVAEDKHSLTKVTHEFRSILSSLVKKG